MTTETASATDTIRDRLRRAQSEEMRYSLVDTDPTVVQVDNDTSGTVHTVVPASLHCSCEDHTYRTVPCKHIMFLLDGNESVATLIDGAIEQRIDELEDDKHAIEDQIESLESELGSVDVEIEQLQSVQSVQEEDDGVEDRDSVEGDTDGTVADDSDSFGRLIEDITGQGDD